MGLLINIDNGGTFTDVCVRDAARVFHVKAPTTPHDLTQCFVESLLGTSAKLYGEEDLGRLLRETDCLRYSTTAGTNAVVERKGVPAALIVEAGEEAEAYGARSQMKDEGLWQSMVLGEPIGLSAASDGEELTRKVNEVLSCGASRLVIALRSEAAEQAVKDLLLEKYPRHLLGAVPFLLSHELIQERDHARRLITALLNSYLHPGMEHFLYGAERVCKANRMSRPLLIFRNDGDSARVAKTTAIKTWGSGPRGGLEGALAYADLYQMGTVVAMDIGGTTTDVAVSLNGKIRRKAFGSVEGMEISFPLPDMRSYGLGGSSIIRVTEGAVSLGPDSVGASPGPACFARGGSEATLTDVLLLAGVIDAEDYLGGELKLDAARAETAVVKAVAEPLGLSLEAAVAAIVEAFAQKQGDQLRQALGQAGQFEDEAALLSFGGGGPMIITAIAEAAGIKRVIVPHMSAVFSAFGIGFSHLAHEYHYPLTPGEDAASAKAPMLERARRDMYGEGVDADRCAYHFSLLTAVDGNLEEQPLLSDRLNGHGEGATLFLRSLYKLPTFSLADNAPAAESALPEQRRVQVALAAGSRTEVPVYRAESLEPGHQADGPALIRGDYLTCLIGPNWQVQVTPNKDLLLEMNS